MEQYHIFALHYKREYKKKFAGEKVSKQEPNKKTSKESWFFVQNTKEYLSVPKGAPIRKNERQDGEYQISDPKNFKRICQIQKTKHNEDDFTDHF